MPAQKLFHSYPSSVWSIATLAHAAVHLQSSTKTGLKALLNYYGELSRGIVVTCVVNGHHFSTAVESDLSYSARAYGKHVVKLKLWLNS